MKYQKIIEVIQWDGKNFDELKSHGGHYIMCDSYKDALILKVKDDTSIKIANIGDYILFTNKGYLKLLSKEDFKKKYIDDGFTPIS